MTRRALASPLVIAALIGLAGVAGLQVEPTRHGPAAALESRPTRVMSTTCRLIAVPPAEARGSGPSPADPAAALRAAEAELREVELQMSSFLESSAVTRLNRAAAGHPIETPPPLLALLVASRELHSATDGAFDVTCLPLLELWRAARQTGVLPEPAALQAARLGSSWAGLEIGPHGITKVTTSVRIDLGAIAKGHGIDRALSALRDAGMQGGLVDVGGDLRVFGTPPQGQTWEARIQDPHGTGSIATLTLSAGAVCTSGPYQRFVELGGKRFSHIIDPRTGWPAEGVASATVLAPDATTADAWATALSVLGPPGLSRLPPGVEAMLVLDTEATPQTLATPGFRAVVQTPPLPTSSE